MPIPIIAIIQALAAGGTLVPHAAGGLIVTGAGGYIASTYITTTALAAYLTGTGLTALAGLGTLLGISGVLGSAGFMGSTIGATGLTGWLMGMGILPATPIFVPILTVIAVVLLPGIFAWRVFRWWKIMSRIRTAPKNVELQFTDSEAAMIQRALLVTHKKNNI